MTARLAAGCVLLGAAASATLAQATWAQEVVGRAVVSGRTVELLSDSSWRYVDPAASACVEIEQRISFCGGPPDWEGVPLPNPQVTAAYRRDDRRFALLIIEGLGTRDGITADALRGIILEYAAAGAGFRPDAVEVADSLPITLDGRPAETLVYRVAPEGIPLVFMNTFFVGKDRTVQLVTYEAGPDRDDADAAFHDEFLALVEVAP